MRIAVALALAFLLAACQRETPDVSQNTPSQSSTTTDATPQMTESNASKMNPVIPPETDNPAARPRGASRTQEVHLIEYAIHMPDTQPPGRVAFNVENGGKENHAFEIEGPGGVETRTNELTRGNTASLEVDLKPGTYTIYCPVDGHRGKGMEKTLVVK
jgi:uncharacterized cupredoxin-like copper-binding protein